eukprot:scaffold17667_cov216-Amphora_coffeaeformis.AAC.4
MLIPGKDPSSNYVYIHNRDERTRQEAEQTRQDGWRHHYPNDRIQAVQVQDNLQMNPSTTVRGSLFDLLTASREHLPIRQDTGENPVQRPGITHAGISREWLKRVIEEAMEILDDDYQPTRRDAQ